MGHPGTAGRADALAARSHSATLASAATLALTGATLTSPCSRSLAARACSVSSGHDVYLLPVPATRAGLSVPIRSDLLQRSLSGPSGHRLSFFYHIFTIVPLAMRSNPAPPHCLDRTMITATSTPPARATRLNCFRSCSARGSRWVAPT